MPLVQGQVIGDCYRIASLLGQGMRGISGAQGWLMVQ